MRKQGVTHDGELLPTCIDLANCISNMAVHLSPVYTDICLETVILSCTSGDARLSEPCYRRRIIDMDRSNPFTDVPSLIDEEIYEIGDQGDGKDLPWNWSVLVS